MIRRKVCKECVYFTGTQCHGHGYFWGECQLLKNIFYELDKTFDNSRDSDLDVWKLVCDDDTICKFYTFLKENKKIN